MTTLYCIAGNIGAGKTTLTKLLAERIGATALYESFETNPYLARFYQDMSRWALPCQLFFLKERFKQIQSYPTFGKVVSDRSIYEDAGVFAKNLHELGHLSEDDWQLYSQFYQIALQKMVEPKLMIYLQASVETLKGRIHIRARNIETGISQDYLTKLNALYERWFDAYKGPKLRINTDGKDFVNKAEDREDILTRITKMLD